MMAKNLAQVSLTTKTPEPAVKQDRSQSQRAKLSSSTVRPQCDLTEEDLSAVREELGDTATGPAAASSTNTSSTPRLRLHTMAELSAAQTEGRLAKVRRERARFDASRAEVTRKRKNKKGKNSPAVVQQETPQTYTQYKADKRAAFDDLVKRAEARTGEKFDLYEFWNR